MVQFASYLRRVLCKTRLIFPRINGPIVTHSYHFVKGHKAVVLFPQLRRELTDDYGVKSRGFALVSLFCPRIFGVYKETSQRERLVKGLLQKWFFQNGLFRQSREESVG